MSREWKPGDVAMLPDGKRAVVAGRCLVYGRGDFANALLHSANANSARPLVVIDPEDREQVRKVMSAYWGCLSAVTSGDPNRSTADDQDAALQAALRSLVADPKPEEPQGLGAVVENDQGRRFIRQHDGWWRGDEPCTLNWAAVHAVRVLSAGWSE